MQKAPLGNTVGNAWLMTWENHTATLCSDLTFLLSAPHGWKRHTSAYGRLIPFTVLMVCTFFVFFFRMKNKLLVDRDRSSKLSKGSQHLFWEIRISRVEFAV